MSMSKSSDRDYISEQEFNRVVIQRGRALPQEDSKGDSAIDETVETEMGENFSENDEQSELEDLNEIDDEDRGHSQGYAAGPEKDADKIAQETSTQGRRASTWPDASDIIASD